jgi:hypothetical protein
MSAQPVEEYDPDDPVEILLVLPKQFHEQFLADPLCQALHDLLRLWRLRAIARSDPTFETRLERASEAMRTGSREGAVAIEDIVPDWPDRLRRR